MPVKVRCPSCNKVLNAPDRARGKAIKCPQCETKIRIPGGAAKAKRASARDDDDGDFLARVDLRHAEDQNVRICPKCATEIEDEEEVECPVCGVDLITGVLSDEMRKLRARQGPDPAGYYGRVWGDAWEFLGANKALVLRTVLIETISSFISLFCLFMAIWCHRLPPRMFWSFFALVSFMIAPGWIWFLNCEIIRSTLNKRKKLKKVHSDFFLNSALGIKVFVWLVIFTIPIHLVTGAIAGIFWAFGFPDVSYSLIGVGFLLGLPFIPVAMPHMAMPVMRNAWWLPRMVQSFSRNPGQTLYWLLPAVTTLTIPVVLAGLNVWLFQDRYQAVFRYSRVMGMAAVIKGIDPKGNVEVLLDKVEKEAALQDALASFLNLMNDHLAKLDESDNKAIATLLMTDTYIRNEEGEITKRFKKDDNWTFSEYFWALWLLNDFMAISAPLLMLASILFSVAAVFNMRTVGLYAHYCRDELDLILEIPEVTYVPKPEDGKRPRKPIPPIVFVLATLVLVLVAGIVLGQNFYETLDVTEAAIGIAAGIATAGNLATVVGVIMLIVAGVRQFIADRNTELTYEEKTETEDKLMTLVTLGQTVVGISFLYYVAAMVTMWFHFGVWYDDFLKIPFFWFMYFLR